MGNVKNNELEQKERRQINKAASTYLCDPDEGDLYDSYLKLQAESEKGNGDDRAADHVPVWQPLEDSVSVDEMIRLIDCAKDDDDQDFPEVLKKIDWTDLRGQKTVLLKLIDVIETTNPQPYVKDGEEMVVLMIPKTAADALNGILNLIDALQDFAVDEMGVNSIHVYDFEEEDKREGYNGDLTPATPVKPADVRYKVWVEIERIETDVNGDETYHDEECPVGIGYRDTLQGARVLRDTIETNFGEI